MTTPGLLLQRPGVKDTSTLWFRPINTGVDEITDVSRNEQREEEVKKKNKREVVKVEPHVCQRSLTSAASALCSFLTAGWHSCGRRSRPRGTKPLEFYS